MSCNDLAAMQALKAAWCVGGWPVATAPLGCKCLAHPASPGPDKGGSTG